MSFEAIHAAIEQQFSSNWNAAATPIMFEGAQRPKGANTKELADLDVFVRLNVFITQSQQAEMNGPTTRNRIEGFVQITLFKKAGSGLRSAWSELDTAKNIFEKKSLSNIQFRTAQGENIPESDGFNGRAIRIPFFIYE